MQRRVGVLGVGKTKNAIHRDKSLRDLFVEACKEALEDAGIGPEDVGMLVVGNHSALGFNGVGEVAPLVGDHTGVVPAPNVTVTAACATGSWAIYVGYMAILSGMCGIALCAGGEKMSDVTTEVSTKIIAQGADYWYEYFTGVTLPSSVALYAVRYMARWGATEEDLAWISVKNHHYGARNPYAQLRFECTVEEVMKSPYVAYPIKLYEVCPITDSASAVILCREELMRDSSKDPVYIIGVGVTSDSFYNTTKQLEDNYSLVERSARPAFEMAGLSPRDVDVLECYNAFAIQEPLGLEAAGFFAYGESWKAIRDGLTHHDGKIPTNITGGVLSKGHPIGGTGTGQAVDIVEQLRGTAPCVQVKDPEIGMQINRGGPGCVCVSIIYKKE